MNHILAFEFDRKFKPKYTVGTPQVYGFSDAGELAHGAVIFLRWELSDGKYSCVPVITKPFAALLKKKKTIPRLELPGCLALTRMYATSAISIILEETNIKISLCESERKSGIVFQKI